MKIRAMRAELFHVDGQTDRRTDRQSAMTKLTVVLHSLANVSKNGSNLSKTKIFTKSVL